MLATADTEIFGADSNPGLTRREILDRCVPKPETLNPKP